MIVWRWWRGGDQPSLRERFAEEKLVDRLADELGDEPEPTVRDANLHLSPTAKAEHRLGEIMEEQRVAGKLPEGRPKKRVAGGPVLPTLESQGIDKHLADPSPAEPVGNPTESVGNPTAAKAKA